MKELGRQLGNTLVMLFGAFAIAFITINLMNLSGNIDVVYEYPKTFLITPLILSLFLPIYKKKEE